MRFIFIISVLLYLTPLFSQEKGIFVAPDGNDYNEGTISRPLASLHRAIQLVKKENTDKIIYFRQGTYKFNTRVLINNLSDVTIKAYQNEKVLFTGGEKISGFKPLDKNVPNYDKIKRRARRKVYYVNLKSQGITHFPRLKPRGFGRAIMPSGLMLYFNGQQMPLARWPNRKWMTIKDVPEELNGKGFVYKRSKPGKWSDVNHIWMHGYWKWNWADAYVKIKNIDKKKKQIIVEDPQSPYPYTRKRRYYYFNILEELDKPGEWYLDRSNGILYFYPPSEINADTEVYVTTLNVYMLMINNSRNIVVENIDFEYSNNGAVKILKGSGNLIKNCRFKNLNTVAVSIGTFKTGNKRYEVNSFFGDAGINNGISGCEISNCGEGGILLGGGDRRTLEKGSNFVENCNIYKTSEWVRTYRPGIHIFGVGNRVSHNEIHDLPHTAILFKGNDHLIEYNNIYQVCTETADAGAIYTGRDWTQTGTHIRYNYIHDLQGSIKNTGAGFNDVIGVYLDDFTSGITVFGNIFYEAGRSVLIGGGRNNTVKNNIFINGNPALHIDARGIDWAKKYFTLENSILFKRYYAVEAGKPLYTEKYPFLKNILKDEPYLPKYNCIENNVFCKGEWRELLDGMDINLVCFKDNIIEKKNCDFYEINNNSIQINFNSSLFKPGFKKIPVEKIGVLHKLN